jgi:CRP-like cAMP-binding protein
MDETRELIERAGRTTDEAHRVAAETRQLIKTSRQLQTYTARVLGRVAGEAGTAFSFDHFSNRLLALLTSAEFERLAPMLQGVTFSRRQILHRANYPIEYVYFPVSGLLSAAITLQDGGTIEVATIGHEGIAGLSAFIGHNDSPCNVVVQIPGYGLRMDVESFQTQMHRGSLLRDILIGYHSAYSVQSAYLVACNGLHSVEKRCCRQLLSIQDRIASSLLPLTHESLAHALGVRRASITDELASLQSRGIVNVRRGEIMIVDRPQLQSLACECYHAVTKKFATLFKSTVVEQFKWPPLAGLSMSRADQQESSKS